jgi:hypothetical protein
MNIENVLNENGINIKNNRGEYFKLNDVLTELSKKWIGIKGLKLNTNNSYNYIGKTKWFYMKYKFTRLLTSLHNLLKNKT